MPLSFMKESVTVIRANMITKNGAEIRDWKNATEHTVDNVQITAQATERDFEGRSLQTKDGRTLRAKYDADIMPGDHVEWNGAIYEVDGEVFHTKSPTGRISTTRCSLIRWEG